MSTKQVIGSLLLLAPMAALAQQPKQVESKGEFAVEGRRIEVDPASSKFNEYSDVRNGFPLYKLGLNFLDTGSGLYFDFNGKNILRKDQTLRMEMGRYGKWSLVLDRDELPHNLSFKAKTPFRNQGGGLFTVDSPVPIPNRNLTPTATQLLANDAATAAWLDTNLRGTSLGTQRDKTGATLVVTPTEHLKFRLSLSDERKVGSKLGYGAIGDRPPRTLNIQLAQPVDYSTREMKLEAEYNRSRYQAQLTYAVSSFSNGIDTFRWQNIYTNYSGGNTFDQWTGHRVATFGQIPLAPDNRYQNATLSLGINLPSASRLSLMAAYGRMEQNQTLLPYSSSSFNGTTVDFSSTASLPRKTADAKITTKRVNLDYTINPASRLNLRAFVHYYGLDNGTPQSNWWYITSDAIPGGSTATVTNPTEKNQRINRPYSFNQTNAGLEASTYLSFWRTSLGLTLERESKNREFREGNTRETRLQGSFRSRPANWLTLRGKYLLGNRDGGAYNTFVSASTYWYDTTVANDNDNPALSFTNHPDMRRFDVSDRKRDQWDLAAMLAPMDALNLTFTYRERKDDFASGVVRTQPLLGNRFAATDADRAAYTPGNQLGLLKNNSQRYAFDLSYAASERLTLNAFASRDTLDLTQRGIEFNEGNKLNPTTASLATNDLGPWTRANSQWMALTRDTTDTVGLGAAFEIIPSKFRVATDYSYSNGAVGISYSGFGAVSSLNPGTTLPDNTQYAFRTPPTVRNKRTTLNVNFAYQLTKNLAAGLRYAYDRYDLSDWMQEANTPWFESVGSQYLLRDSSSATSNQWGNRLVNLGSYLAPTYDAHFVSLSLKYTF